MAYIVHKSENGNEWKTMEEAIAEDEREERKKDPLAKLKLPWGTGSGGDVKDSWAVVVAQVYGGKKDIVAATMNLLPLIQDAAKNVGKPEAMQSYAQLLSAYYKIEDMAKKL